MNDIQKLIAILELTREQPQYGYVSNGVPLHEVSNLAEHHFLVAWIGLLLAKLISKAGKNVNEQRVVELCMMHDLGELLGGDVSGPLSRKFPELKRAAQEIEDRNYSFLVDKAKQSGLDDWMNGLWQEEGKKESLESVIAKIADLMEIEFFLEHRSRQIRTKDPFYRQYIKPLADKIDDVEIRRILEQFFTAYEQTVHGKNFQADKFLLGE